MIVPLVMAKMIDVGIANRDTGYVVRMGLVMILLGVVGLCCALVCQYCAARASQGFGTVVRSELFAHINRLSHGEIDRFGTPSLITRITNDVNQLQVAVAMLIRLVIRSPFLVIGSAVMAIMLDWKLATVFLIAGPLVALVLYLILSRSIPYYRVIQKKLDRISLITRENLSGVRVIRAFSTQGEVIAFVNYLNQILLAMIATANLFVIFTKAAASASRVNEVLDTVPTVANRCTEPACEQEESAKIAFENVSFVYPSAGDYSLSDISLEINKGQTVGIIGGTGCGKSTLVNLIPRFYDVSSGRVTVDGVDVRNYPMVQLRKKIGVVPQKAVLFSGTLRENMTWHKKKATDEEIWKALQVAQAEEFVRKMPDGLDTVLLQGGKNLSGGQKQRLTIARALIGEPEILILDDSASALDFATDAALRRAIAEFTRERGGKMTTLIVSQRANTVRDADCIVVLDDGKITGMGTHSELLNCCQEYAEIYWSQNERQTEKVPTDSLQKGER